MQNKPWNCILNYRIGIEINSEEDADPGFDVDNNPSIEERPEWQSGGCIEYADFERMIDLPFDPINITGLSGLDGTGERYGIEKVVWDVDSEIFRIDLMATIMERGLEAMKTQIAKLVEHGWKRVRKDEDD